MFEVYMDSFNNFNNKYYLVTPSNHDIYKRMCVILEGHVDHRDLS